MRPLYSAAFIALSFAMMMYSFQSSQQGSHKVDAQTEKEVLKVLDDYMNTFNSRDAKEWQATYHFPHYRLASGKMSVLESATLDSTTFIRLEKSGWHHSKWEHRNIIQGTTDKVHVDTQFSRFRKDGTKLGAYESLYVVTKENGKWGVKLRSSYAE